MNLLLHFISSRYFPLTLILVIGISASVLLRQLTLAAALTGGLLAFSIFAGAGYTGITMLAVFFVMASVATRMGMAQKLQLGVAEANKGRRTASQVAANAAVAGILGLLACLAPSFTRLFCIMMAGAISAATADTLSSELGSLYGRRFYNILSLKPDIKGLNGVVSMEGTLAGIAGSAVIAAIEAAGFGLNKFFWVIIISGFAGNIADSVLGAALERQNRLNNDAVNFLNTLTGSLCAWLLYYLFKR